MSSEIFDAKIKQIEIAQSHDNENQTNMKENVQPSTSANVAATQPTPRLKNPCKKRGPGQPHKDAEVYERQIKEAELAGDSDRVQVLKNNKSSQKYRDKKSLKFNKNYEKLKKLKNIRNKLMKIFRKGKGEIKNLKEKLKLL